MKSSGGAAVETLYANQTLSLSDFKRNPSAAVRAAAGRPLAVLNHNRVSFYVVEPGLFEALQPHRPATDPGFLRQIEPGPPETPQNPEA